MTWRRLLRAALLATVACQQLTGARALSSSASSSSSSSSAAAGDYALFQDESGSKEAATRDNNTVVLSCEAQGLYGVAVLGKRGVFCLAQQPCAGKPGAISRFACPQAGDSDVNGTSTLENGSCCAELSTGIIGCVSLDNAALNPQCLPSPAWYTPVTGTPRPTRLLEPTPTPAPSTEAPSPTPTQVWTPISLNGDPDAGDPTPSPDTPSPPTVTPTPTPTPSWSPSPNWGSDASSSSGSSSGSDGGPDVGSVVDTVLKPTVDPAVLEQADRDRNDFETMAPIIELTPNPTMQRFSDPGVIVSGQPTSSSSSNSSLSVNDNTLVFLVVGAVASIAVAIGAVMLHRKVSPERTTASIQELELGTPSATAIAGTGGTYGASATPREGETLM